MAKQSVCAPDDLDLVFSGSEFEEEKDESAKMMESNTYPRKLMEHLNGQRTNKEYCDFTIHVGDKEFPVHQNILAARSEYFNVMFTSKMKESFEKQTAMKDISENCMKWILDFLYSGKIEFSLKNIEEIIKSAALMQIQDLLDLATDYVVQVLSPQNCLCLFQIGKLHLLDDLVNAAKKYLLSHFDEAAQQDGFVDLDFQDLGMFLSSQEVVVINEKKVYAALMRWLKHKLDSRKEYFSNLFQHIRLSELPLTYIEDDIRKEDFLYEFRSCCEKIMKHYYLFGSKTNIEANPRKGLLPADANIGFITNGAYNHIDINPSENKFQLREVEKVKKKVRRDFSSSILSSCVHGNNGYVCDQYNLYCFDGKGKTIAELPDNFECQYMVYIDLIEVQSVRGFRSARPTTRASLFLLGKIISRNERTYQIYKFDIENKQFNEVETCSTPWRTGASVVAVGGKMYIMGGYLYRCGSPDKTASDLVDILNLNGWPSWKIGQNLNIPRADFAAAQLRSRIYSFGGFGKNNERLTSGEFMDFSDGVWNKLTNHVPLPLGSASAFCVGDHIAVYGKGETLKKIFLFNSFNEEWVVLENVEKVEHVSMRKGGRWKKCTAARSPAR